MVVTRSSRKSHGVSTEVKVEHAVVQVKVKQEPAKRSVPAVVKKEPQAKRKRSAPTSAAAAAAAGGKRAKVKQEPRATVKQELRASVKQEAKVKVEAGAGTKAAAKSDAAAAKAAAKAQAAAAKAAAKAQAAATKSAARTAKAAEKAAEAARKARVKAQKRSRTPVGTIKVTGTSFRATSLQKALAAHGEVLEGDRFRAHGHTVALRREPSNPYDRHAVAVVISGHHVGYVPKAVNQRVRVDSTYIVWGLRYIPYYGSMTCTIAEMPDAYDPNALAELY
jgi:hypothetical protein